MSGAMIFSYVILFIIVVAVIVWLLAWMYRRSTKETSFVRTGFLGQKVVINGGALVIPVLHETMPVNMNTLRLEVRRGNEQALITRDRMRVDVVAEFYVRVQATRDAVAAAAQTLGRRTMEPDSLKELVEGKFVDALRDAAAEMTMEELHEQRSGFVTKVKESVAEDLMKNGLELDAVSLTGFNQTNLEFFNPSNAFDAEGLTKLTETIEKRKKVRNDIEQDTLIQIRNKNLETEKLNLEIDLQSENARLDQSLEVEASRAQQAAEVAKKQAEQQRTREQYEIKVRQDIETSRIATDQALEEERITKERIVQEKETERRKAVEISEQERAIAVADKSKEQSESLAQADTARAKAVKAEEAIFTARETEIAERKKQVELIGARQQAERAAIAMVTAAQAGREAAEDRAKAVEEEARGKAEADKIATMAAELRYKVDAEGTRAINEARNILSPEQTQSNYRIALLENMDKIIRESVKPMEKIEGIKIVHMDGFGGNSSSGGDEDNPKGGLADNVVNSALRYRAQAPLIDSLLKEIGMSGGDIQKMTAALVPSQEGEMDEE